MILSILFSRLNANTYPFSDYTDNSQEGFENQAIKIPSNQLFKQPSKIYNV